MKFHRLPLLLPSEIGGFKVVTKLMVMSVFRWKKSTLPPHSTLHKADYLR